MRWLWNNSIVLIYWGAGAVAAGFVCAFFSLVGFGSVFRQLSLCTLAAGVISILCSLVVFCLRFGVKSRPKKVIAFAASAQAVLAISFFTLYKQVDFYVRLYSPFARLIVGGLWFVLVEMAALLLLIGLIRLFFYSHRRASMR